MLAIQRVREIEKHIGTSNIFKDGLDCKTYAYTILQNEYEQRMQNKYGKSESY